VIEEFGAAEPLSIVMDFKHQAYALRITLGYMTFPHSGLMLFAMEQWGDRPPVLWRKFWVTNKGAVRAANRLAIDACEYLNTVSKNWRPAEDLNFDDFIEHIRLHVEGGMH
jgi:hypothetical protein